MGNFPDILRKPALVPVTDRDEMFSSVYLTVSCHPVEGECGGGELSDWWGFWGQQLG